MLERLPRKSIAKKREGTPDMRAFRRSKRLLVPVFLMVALLLGLLPGLASGSTTGKLFSTQFQPTNPKSICPGSDDASFTFRINNVSTTKSSFGSANISLPSALSDVDVTTPASVSTGVRTWTAGYDEAGHLIQLRNTGKNSDAVPPSGWVDVTFTADVTSAASGSWTWGQSSGEVLVQVKQANSFSGPPGNDFVQSTRPGFNDKAQLNLRSNCLQPGESTSTTSADGETSATFTLVSGTGAFDLTTGECEGQPGDSEFCIGSSVTITPDCDGPCRGLLVIEYANSVQFEGSQATADGLGVDFHLHYEKPDQLETFMTMCDTTYTGGVLQDDGDIATPAYDSGNPQGTIDDLGDPIPCLWKFQQVGPPGGGSNKLQLQIVIDGIDPKTRLR